MNERWHDDQLGGSIELLGTNKYSLLHPIRITRAFLDRVLEQFDVLYENFDGTTEVKKRGYGEKMVYGIYRKKGKA